MNEPNQIEKSRVFLAGLNTGYSADEFDHSMEELQELAEKVANTMKCPPEHALAIIIRTVLLDDSDKR